MILNKKPIAETLKAHNIDSNKGLLCLLAYYFDLDPDSTIDEETIKALALTKIVEKDYAKKTITWNIPLFEEQQTEWDWVIEWNNMWNINKSRKASNPDVTKRMKVFFSTYPQYRKDDVIKATQMYFAANRDPNYWKNSAAFIFDGAGAMKKSILSGWCEKATTTLQDFGNMKGNLITD